MLSRLRLLVYMHIHMHMCIHQQDHYFLCLYIVSHHSFIQRVFLFGTHGYNVTIHLAEIVGIDFALMMSQFTFNRPPLRMDTGGGDADLSLYADHVLSIYHPLHSLRLAPTMPCISLVTLITLLDHLYFIAIASAFCFIMVSSIYSFH